MLFHDRFVKLTSPAVYDSSSRHWCTYGELYENADKLSKCLIWPAKALVFCFCRRDLPTISWYLASLQSNHAIALLDDGLSTEFKRRLVSLYAPDFIVSSTEATSYSNPEFGSAGDAYERIPSRDRQNSAWRRRRVGEGAIHTELALLLSTSGSTGSPKFVRLTKANLLANAESICESLSILPEDRPISSLPIYYSFGLSVLNTHLRRGASIVMTDEGLTSQAFWGLFRDMQCTSLAGVPYSYQVLRRLNLNTLSVPTLRVLTQAGGKLQNDLIAHFYHYMKERSGRFYVMYGQTEATARIAVLPPECLPAKLGAAGVAIPNGTLTIDADGVETTKAFTNGELIYRGPNVMMGYANNRSDLSSGDELKGILRTGDLAHFDEDGFVFIDGRMKRDFKLFGLRLNLDEIENMLRRHGPTAVLGHANRLVIFCEYGNQETLMKQKRDLASKLMIHHQALEFRKIDCIPTNASGKVDYSVLATQI